MNIRFLSKDEIDCPLALHHLRKRVTAEADYRFEQAKFRAILEDIIVRNATNIPARDVGIIEVYTGNRYFSSIEYQGRGTVIFDYGFVELIADSVALEYLDYTVTTAMNEWSLAGRPDNWFEGGGGNRAVNWIELEGTRHHITGSMVMRDMACKFLEDIVAEPLHRDRLKNKLLWATADGSRPNMLHYRYLSGQPVPPNVMRAFANDANGNSNIIDQTLLASAFVACHEISHVTFSDADHREWLNSELAKDVMELHASLCELSWEHDERRYTYGELAEVYQVPEVKRRVFREAIIDIRAIDMLIERQRQQWPKLEDWSLFFANLFSLVSMVNALGIFRAHVVASIRNRSIDSSHMLLAQSEAVARNLILLSYIWYRNKNLAGHELAEQLLLKIDEESIILRRKRLHFYLDLVSGVSEEQWADFTTEALS